MALGIAADGANRVGVLSPGRARRASEMSASGSQVSTPQRRAKDEAPSPTSKTCLPCSSTARAVLDGMPDVANGPDRAGAEPSSLHHARIHLDDALGIQAVRIDDAVDYWVGEA